MFSSVITLTTVIIKSQILFYGSVEISSLMLKIYLIFSKTLNLLIKANSTFLMIYCLPNTSVSWRHVSRNASPIIDKQKYFCAYCYFSFCFLFFFFYISPIILTYRFLYKNIYISLSHLFGLLIDLFQIF